MRKLRFIFLLTLIASQLSVVSAQEVISLEGSWDLSLNDSTHYDDYVMLPGTLQTNGKSNPATEGKVWYRKGVYIPRDWKRQRVTLFLERPYTATTVYVNGREVGHQTSRFTPHQFDVSSCLVPGYRNSIAVCVDGGERNGITGRMELSAMSHGISIRQVKINPELVDGKLEVSVRLDSEHHPITYEEDMTVVIAPLDMNDEIYYITTHEITSQTMKLRIPIETSFAFWDEFNPQLYQIGIIIGSDSYETTFGVRQVRAEGGRLSINGRPLWLRGTVDSGIFPNTGYPPTDESEWTDIFTKVKAYGLNHLRFRSYCPPDAAFAAADKLGVYLLLEGSLKPEELKDVADVYGRHPSLVMMAAGDADGGWKLPMIACEQGQEELALCYKQKIERHLLTNTAGYLLPTLNDCSRVLAKEWREFCSPLVVLARFPKYAFTNADTLQVPIVVNNALFGNISRIRKNYMITEGERVIAGGGLSSDSIPMGNCEVGTVVFPLDTISQPTKLTLTVRIGKEISNHWDFWVRPETIEKREAQTSLLP